MKVEDGLPPAAVSDGAALLRAYHLRKRAMVFWSGVVAIPAALGIAFAAPFEGLAFAIGTACGLLNAYLTMRNNERLGGHHRVGVFVFSSILRVAVFGIVPVELALRGPATAILTYFAGFFVPLGCYAVLTARFVKMSSST